MPACNLLVRELQDQVSEHFSRLREVQQRLIELLARFRQQHARNRLVRGMLEHLQRYPNFKPGDYAQRTEVPLLFNQAAALQPAASLSLDRLQDGDVLRELLQALPPAPQPRVLPAEAAGVISHAEHEVVLARRRALQQDVESFFLQVWQQQGRQSALDWLRQSNLEWDAEIWLYQVIAAYQGLAAADQRMFRLDYHEQPERPDRPAHCAGSGVTGATGGLSMLSQRLYNLLQRVEARLQTAASVSESAQPGSA